MIYFVETTLVYILMNGRQSCMVIPFLQFEHTSVKHSFHRGCGVMNLEVVSVRKIRERNPLFHFSTTQKGYISVVTP
jgi:hypothetical protein